MLPRLAPTVWIGSPDCPLAHVSLVDRLRRVAGLDDRGHRGPSASVAGVPLRTTSLALGGGRVEPPQGGSRA